MHRASFALALVLGALFLETAYSSDLLGLGGFVSVSQEFSQALGNKGLDQPDLSAIRVEVLTPNGVKLFEGDCAPNGYYFVPTEPGAYVVRASGEHGWTFNPAQVSVTCDSEKCHGGEDVDFQLTGLQITGHVEAAHAQASCKAATAPSRAGITIRLRNSNLRTKTDSAGRFSFGGLVPGDYEVAAEHSDAQLQPSRISHALTLDSTAISQPFVIQGYSLAGTVTSRSGPVAGVRVTLSSDQIPATAVGCSSTKPPADAASGALCSVVSGTDGRYTFPGVPCGQYTLSASHPDPSSTFQIEPQDQPITMGVTPTEARTPFTVVGFSISGSVVDHTGQGLADVQVLVGGKPSATTDSSGKYVLSKLQEGALDLAAKKEGHTFGSLAGVQVTPSSTGLPPLNLEAVSLCGRVGMTDKRFSSSRTITVTDQAAGKQEQVRGREVWEGGFNSSSSSSSRSSRSSSQ